MKYVFHPAEHSLNRWKNVRCSTFTMKLKTASRNFTLKVSFVRDWLHCNLAFSPANQQISVFWDTVQIILKHVWFFYHKSGFVSLATSRWLPRLETCLIDLRLSLVSVLKTCTERVSCCVLVFTYQNPLPALPTYQQNPGYKTAKITSHAG